MSLYVVDASLVIKWYIPEALSEEADRFLARIESTGEQLIAPDFLLVELGNVLWKKAHRKEITDATVHEILDALLNRLSVHLIESNLLIQRAVEIATQTSCSVYDSLYLSAADTYDALLITADQKLCKTVKRHGLGHRIVFLGSA